MKNIILRREDIQNINVWFTSDLHFDHRNICKFCNRPFDTIEEMNLTLMRNWNDRVQPNDIIFVLGDFCFSGRQRWEKILNQLNGTKYLIQGNHDKPSVIPNELFEDVMELCMLQVYNVDTNEYLRFFLSHYCMLTWPGQWAKFKHLFGHVHSRPNNTGLDKDIVEKRALPSWDVGVDNNNYYPYSLQDLVKIFNSMNNEKL